MKWRKPAIVLLMFDYILFVITYFEVTSQYLRKMHQISVAKQKGLPPNSYFVAYHKLGLLETRHKLSMNGLVNCKNVWHDVLTTSGECISLQHHLPSSWLAFHNVLFLLRFTASLSGRLIVVCLALALSTRTNVQIRLRTFRLQSGIIDPIPPTPPTLISVSTA